MKKLTALVLALACLLCLVGCSRASLPKKTPEDFVFSLTWNCYGVSSYDSKTGTLIKTSDTENPEAYTTHYELPEAYKDRIYACIRALDPYAYPDIYDPNAKKDSKPPMTLILTVYANGTAKTIEAKNIALSYESADEKGQMFLTACKTIQDILTETEEWNALPEPEWYYE